MTLPVIGIIGMGYLGREIARQETWPTLSWGTTHVDTGSREQEALKLIHFNWQDTAHWERLPSFPGTLILTIPPVFPNVTEEIKRLRDWGSWMNQNRPGYQSLIYISTTGVYPNRNGNWEETDVQEPDTNKGRLRLATERALADFFELKVIRPGAIYGNGRNIGERILAGKPVPSGAQPVHRIHVTDLARIIRMAVTKPTFPTLVNAVDSDSTPSRLVAEWLLEQPFNIIPPTTRLKTREGFATRKKQHPADRRFIDNRVLVETCRFQFKHPTYKEGLKDCLT